MTEAENHHADFFCFFNSTAIKHYLHSVFQKLLGHNPGGLLILCKRRVFFFGSGIKYPKHIQNNQDFLAVAMLLSGTTSQPVYESCFYVLFCSTI